VSANSPFVIGTHGVRRHQGRWLVALGLLVLLAGASTVVRFPVFALVDERAHYACER